MSNTSQTTDSDFDSTDRDPGRPTVRLSEADKQVSLTIERLEAEAEHLDPDLIQRLEGAVETIRAVDRELRTLESVTNGGEE